MVQQIRPTKYVPETISYFVDFTDLLNGETIQPPPVITITLVDGVDPNPSTMLFQGATISGNVIEQRLRKGIEGCIYYVSFSVTSTTGHVYEKEFYLAILPGSGNAIPDYQPAWLTSYPYPYYVLDSFQAAPSVDSWDMLWNPNYHENITSTSQIGFMNVYGGLVSYAIPHENVTSSTSIQGMNIYGGLVTYNYEEGIISAVAVLFGNIYGGLIEYDNPHEDITSSPSIISGTLM